MNKTKNKQIAIYILNITVLLFIFRNANPLFKYPFLGLYSGIVIYSLFEFRKVMLERTIKFAGNFYLLIILLLLFLFCLVFAEKLYLVAFKDLMNGIIILSLFFLLTLFISNRQELSIYFISLINCIFFFAILITITGLLKIFDIYSFNNLSGNDFQFFYSDNLLKNSQKIDYNFAVLPVIFGLICIFYYITKDRKLQTRAFFFIITVFFALHIFLSGSRRGLGLLAALVVVSIIIKIIYLFSKKPSLNILNSISGYFLSVILLIFSLVFILVNNTSFHFKDKTLEFLGTKNKIIARTGITLNICRYSTLINNDASVMDVYHKIWSTSRNPLDPDLGGWGLRTHKTIFPLSGENKEIVPSGAKGYLMDKSCNANILDGNAYSWSIYCSNNFQDGDIINASVYCFVPEDFNGTGASIALADKEGRFIGTDSYDLNNKNTWQKLNINTNNTTGEVSLYLLFSKSGVPNFSSLEGYVIFACPSLNEGDLENSKMNSNSTLLNISNSIGNDSLCYSSETYSENNISHVNNLSFSLPFLNLMLHLPVDRDPVRNFISKLISEDTTYYAYSANIKIDTISDNFISHRTVRWQFGWQIFKKEYNWSERIFGGGFNFLNWYGFYFLKDKTESDWPHNPFLSVLLYSGIIGLSIYLFFLYKVFYYYTKYIKEYPLLFIFFIITFFFTFFSGGSPLDPPVMGFFVMLPFLIHSVHKNKMLSQSEIQINERK